MPDEEYNAMEPHVSYHPATTHPSTEVTYITITANLPSIDHLAQATIDGVESTTLENSTTSHCLIKKPTQQPPPQLQTVCFLIKT